MLEWYYWLLISIAILIFLIILIRCIFNGPKTPLDPKNSLYEKVVIVTGSNTGIGQITAFELLKKGAVVIYAARNEEKTMKIINSLSEDMKTRAFYFPLDLSKFSSIKNFVENFSKKFTRLDILVNNAGGIFEKLRFSEGIEHTLMTNTVGPICLTALLFKYLNSSGEGKIINVSSIAHKFCKDKQLKYLMDSLETNNKSLEENFKFDDVYSLSKLGNLLYSKFIKYQYGENSDIKIKSVSLHPGIVNSDLFSVKRSERGIFKCIKFCIYPFMLLFFKSSYMGAQTQLHCCYMDYNSMNSGDYFNNCKVEKLKEFYEDERTMKAFMTYVKKMVDKNWLECPQEIKDHLNFNFEGEYEMRVYGVTEV